MASPHPLEPREHAARPQRPIGALLADLLKETQTLLHKELALLRAELGGKIGQVGMGLGSLVASALILFCGLLVLLAAVVLGLGTFMPTWVAALIVGILVLALGAFFFLVAVKRLKAGSLVPRVTLEEIRRDREFIKEQWR